MTRRRSTIAASLATLASAGLLAAGCGGHSAAPGVADIGSSTTNATTTTQSSSGQGGTGTNGQTSGSGGGAQLSIAGKSSSDLAAFASCMRTHGVPKFPDPTGGGISIDRSSGIDPTSPQFQSAQRACRKFMPAGKAPSPAQQAKMQAEFLAYAACMRSHGVPNFPDPQFSAGRVSMRLSGIDPNSPAFQQAQKACSSDLPGKLGAPKGAVPIGGGAKTAG